MLERIKDVPAGIDALKAVGKLTKEDYTTVFEPLLDEARRNGRRLRLVYQLGPEFQGFSPSAAWEDAKMGLRSMRLFDACAILTDLAWVREAAKLAGFLMPCPVRIFASRELGAATEWLRSLPERAAVSHRLLSDSGSGNAPFAAS